VSKSALPRIVLVLVLVGGAVLRLEYGRRAVPFYGPPGMDDLGTVALMSQHILEGRERPLYFYGQEYSGALAAYIGAVTFALFGPSLFSLCIAMLPFALLWIFATYLLFRRLGGEAAGLIAAALVAFAPPALMYFSIVPFLGYLPVFAFGTLMLYLGVRLNDPDATARAEWLCLGGLGALAGLAIWTQPLCLPYLVAAFGLVVVRLVRSRSMKRLIPKLGLAAALCAVTLIPVIVTASRRGLGGMFGLWPTDIGFIPGNAQLLMTEYVPDQLLARGQVPAAVLALAEAAYIVLGAGFVLGLVLAIARRHRPSLRAALVPLAFVVVFLGFFLSNSKSAVVTTRYFTPFYLGVVACLVFPLAARRRWLTAAAAVLIALVIGHNVAAVLGQAYGAPARAAALADAALEKRVRAVEATGLRHVMTPRYNGQVMTFLAGERVIFAALSRDCYYPYTVAASADDRTGFMMPDADAPAFEATLRSLGVTSFSAFPAEGWTVFGRFELPSERLELVEPAAVFLVAADGSITPAGGLADHNEETIVGDRFGAESSLVFDFGRSVRLRAVRFIAPSPLDYPVGYTLDGATETLDGAAGSEPQWTDLQRVEAREPRACIAGNRLYEQGHDTVMECRFPAASVRLLRIGELRPRAGFKVWRFREVCCYAEAGPDGLPDEQEAAEIAGELARAGVEFAVCDEWLSRKIEMAPGPGPRVLPHYEAREPSSHVSRLLPIRRGVAVVVGSAHAEQARTQLDEATLGDISVMRRDSPHYTAFVIAEAPADYASFPGLRWNGLTLTRTARIAAADWYSRHGEQLDRAGQRDQAMRYFTKSFETFSGIRANLERLAARNEPAAGALAALTPRIEAPIRFPHDASLVGYTLTPSPLVPGERATLRLVWELEGDVRHDVLPVFVHFTRDGGILFQADHNAVFPVEPGATVPRALVLDEHEFDVPAGVAAGDVTIRLGVTAPSDPAVRLKPRTKLPTAHRAVEIGRAQVSG
jgi:4-amino-4-deoxy-L-arabinose transferase-like glycosyltransferase